MTTLSPRFTITNRITADLAAIERARGFLEAATISEEWVSSPSLPAPAGSVTAGEPDGTGDSGSQSSRALPRVALTSLMRVSVCVT